jgi:hypothetical protein
VSHFTLQWLSKKCGVLEGKLVTAITSSAVEASHAIRTVDTEASPAVSVAAEAGKALVSHPHETEPARALMSGTGAHPAAHRTGRAAPKLPCGLCASWEAQKSPRSAALLLLVG